MRRLTLILATLGALGFGPAVAETKCPVDLDRFQICTDRQLDIRDRLEFLVIYRTQIDGVAVYNQTVISEPGSTGPEVQEELDYIVGFAESSTRALPNVRFEKLDLALEDIRYASSFAMDGTQGAQAERTVTSYFIKEGAMIQLDTTIPNPPPLNKHIDIHKELAAAVFVKGEV